jgi:hypothetical protein
VVELLVKKGANVNLKYGSGRTLLSYAASIGIRWKTGMPPSRRQRRILGKIRKLSSRLESIFKIKLVRQSFMAIWKPLLDGNQMHV